MKEGQKSSQKMKNSIINFLPNIIWLLVIAIPVIVCEADPPNSAPADKHYVVIFNDLGHNHTLTAHCRSEDKDLGEVKITNGNSTKWELGVPPVTVHYCDMSYANHKGHFDVFVQDRDLDLCDGECRWYARPDGLYIHYSNGDTTERMYTWSNE